MMGAGAGVSVRTNDYEISAENIRGNSLMVPIGESYMESYEWGCRCRHHSGYIEVRDFMKNVASITAKDVTGFDDYYRHADKDIVGFDTSAGIGLSDGYHDKDGLDFIIGGGYMKTTLRYGSSTDVSSPYSGIEIIVEGTVRFDDGTTTNGWVGIYCEELIFHPSDRFVDIYEYCWDHWVDDDFDIYVVEDMFGDDDGWYPVKSFGVKKKVKPRKTPPKKKSLVKSKVIKPKTKRKVR